MTAISRAIKAVAVTGALASAAAGSALVGTAPAQAAHKNGTCEVGEFCMYYFQNYSGPIFDLYVSDNDFSDDYFPGTSIRADNNTESDWNRDSYTWYVYTGPNRGGSRGYVSPGEYGNFSSTYRNTVSSAYWYL